MELRSTFAASPLLALLVVPGVTDASDELWHNNDHNCVCSMSQHVRLGRSTLEDFTVDADGWLIDSYVGRHIWNVREPGFGAGYNLWIRENVPDPGYDEPEGPSEERLMSLAVEHYEEIGLGSTCFSRPAFEAWADLEPVYLPPGRYWLEMQIVASEEEDDNCFMLCADEPIRGNGGWVDYQDFDGLQPSWVIFGIWRTQSFTLYGMPIHCAADVNHTGAVDFADVLDVLSAWGICINQQGCPEDVNGDRVVDFEDLLALLAAWGPCF